MNYRADIQVLRGLSVLMVIIYHLQVGIMQNGFLGVDIFFVISGFLMAVLYYPNAGYLDSNNQNSHNQSNTVNPKALSADVISSFYGRRLRRILPAYFFIIAIVLITGSVWLNNAEFQNLKEHSVYASLMLPNIPYWLHASYFDAQNFRPLLHLWSIGVEFQFYLIVPIIFALYQRSKTSVIVISLISLIICMAISDRASNTAFFMLPLRLWEFMLGFLAALLLSNSGNIKHQQPIIGLAALSILILIGLSGSNLNLSHPGPAALLVCIATTVILVTGLPATLLNSIVGKVFVTLGRYSYSAYLCHYPIILFVAYQPFEGAIYDKLTPIHIVLICLMTALLSVAMYHFVELPLRKRNNRLTKLPHLLAAITVCVCLAFGLNNFQRSFYSDQQINVVEASHERAEFRCGTLYGLANPFAQSCDLTNNSQDASKGYLLVGNSHADSLKVVLAEMAIKHGASMRLWKDNLPLGWANTTPDNVINEAKAFNITTILLHNSKTTLKADALRELILKTQTHGIDVVYIDPVPTWKESVPAIIWKEVSDNQLRPIKGRGQHHLENTVELQQLNALSDEKHKNFTRILTSKWICTPQCAITDKDNIPLYYDSHHLNLRGAESLKPMFKSVFR